MPRCLEDRSWDKKTFLQYCAHLQGRSYHQNELHSRTTIFFASSLPTYLKLADLSVQWEGVKEHWTDESDVSCLAGK